MKGKVWQVAKGYPDHAGMNRGLNVPNFLTFVQSKTETVSRNRSLYRCGPRTIPLETAGEREAKVGKIERSD